MNWSKLFGFMIITIGLTESGASLQKVNMKWMALAAVGLIVALLLPIEMGA